MSTFNARGLGGRVKKNKIQNLIRLNKVEFMAIQETKLEVITPSLCYNLWGSEDCEWVFCPSVGNSGGILSLWSKSSATTLFTFQGEGYVGVCLEWGVLKHRCVVINVYAKCNLAAKRRMWDSITNERKTRGGGTWCVLGDFNSVLRRDERRGVNVEMSSTHVLESFSSITFWGRRSWKTLVCLVEGLRGVTHMVSR